MSNYTPNFISPGIKNAPDPVSERPLLDKARHPTTKFKDSNRSLFILGPIYEFVKLPFDLVSQFLVDINSTADIQTYAVEHVLVQGLTNWANIIYSVPNDVASLFTKWMVTQIFRDSNKNLTWQLRAREIELIDPAALYLGQVDVSKLPITIFLPFCEKVVIDGKDSMDYPYTAYKLFIRHPEVNEFPDINILKI